jgi:hypothetical protein
LAGRRQASAGHVWQIVGRQAQSILAQHLDRGRSRKYTQNLIRWSADTSGLCVGSLLQIHRPEVPKWVGWSPAARSCSAGCLVVGTSPSHMHSKGWRTCSFRLVGGSILAQRRFANSAQAPGPAWLDKEFTRRLLPQPRWQSEGRHRLGSRVCKQEPDVRHHQPVRPDDLLPSHPRFADFNKVCVSVSKLSVGVERFVLSQPVLTICVRGVGVHVWPIDVGPVACVILSLAWPAALTSAWHANANLWHQAEAGRDRFSRQQDRRVRSITCVYVNLELAERRLWTWIDCPFPMDPQPTCVIASMLVLVGLTHE